MEYDLDTIYEILTNGKKLEDAKSGEAVEIKGRINGFHIPSGGKITYLPQDLMGPELKITYGYAVIEVGKKYVSLSKVPESMYLLVRFLDDNIIGEFEE